MLMKKIKAVEPYIYPNQLNFKDKPVKAWRRLGGEVVEGWYPRLLHKLLFSVDMPTLWHGEARLVFVQPVSLYFDAGFSVLTHEVIPFIWDCWPRYYDKMEKWMHRHKVKMAFFTSSQEMEAMQQRLPEVKMVHCPEGVDASLYDKGKQLTERSIDLLEFGRGLLADSSSFDEEFGRKFERPFNHVRTQVDGKFLFTEEQLYKAIADAKVTICLPRSVTHPDVAEGVETLTQRYWEAMLSRNVIIGKAPQELIDLIGYNPLIDLHEEGFAEQLNEILSHIEDYQALVDKNYETALRLAPWDVRMQQVMRFL